MSVKNTLYEMFEQRGYKEIKENNQLCGYVAKKKNNNPIIGFYEIIEKLKIEELKNYICIAKQQKISHMILVYREKTPQVKVAETLVDNIEIKIEIFPYCDLLINITKHELVPKHILIEGDSPERLEVKNKISLSNLPILLKTDPVARFYGYEKGDLVKVLRKNGHVTYRVVR